jgi:hypothetical protein
VAGGLALAGPGNGRNLHLYRDPAQAHEPPRTGGAARPGSASTGRGKQLDIPAGTFDAVLKLFENATGLHIAVSNAGMPGRASPGSPNPTAHCGSFPRKTVAGWRQLLLFGLIARILLFGGACQCGRTGILRLARRIA